VPAIDRTLFQATLKEEIREAWRTLKAAHPSEHFYSFGLYTAACAEYLMVTAGTEEGLSLVTETYVQKYGGDPALRRVSLRWFQGDSPLHLEGEDLLPRSTALRDAGPDPYDDSPEGQAAVTLVFETAVAVLSELDREGTFGSDAERSALVLGIWIGDQSDEERIDFVRALNPPPVTARFVCELDEGMKAFVALSQPA
jgi:hypothetical protein